MVQHVQSPTHEHGHTLDLVISKSSNDDIRNLLVESCNFSDHHHTMFNLTVRKLSQPKKIIHYRETRKIEVESFCEDILDSHLEHAINNEGDIEAKLRILNNSLCNILDKHAPVVEKTITIRPNCKWFTNDICEAKHRRRKFEKLWRQTKLPMHKEQFKKCKVQMQKLIHQSKKAYVKNNISEAKRNPKALFKILNGLVKLDKPTQYPTHSNEKHLADRFGNFFKEKIDRLRDTMPTKSFIQSTRRSDHDEHTLSNFHPTTPEEVAEIVLQSPPKSCQLDSIPTWLMKACINVLSGPICSIINTSLETATLPASFKEAIVTPILKKTSLDKEHLKNYRPVSNLNFISKVIEKVVAKRIQTHLGENNITIPFQSAYKKGHSTETALLRIYNDIVCKINNTNNINLLLLDLSAAFDTIDHETLYQRLHDHFQISDNALLWFRAYLSGCNTRVSINGSMSDPLPLKCGVPQGSVLGPIIFSLYTAPLGDFLSESGICYHIYADDTQLYTPVDKNSAIAVGSVGNWMAQNKLKLNGDKTELIVFRKAKAEIHNQNLSVSGAIIENSSPVRNLGFLLDEFLSMEDQISKVCKTCNFMLHQIGRVRSTLDKESTKLLVHSLVTSHLDYCNSLYAALPKKVISRLQKIQNRAARLINRSRKFDHITPVLKSLHWLPVESRICYKTACLAYKAIHNSGPHYLQDLLSVYEPTRNLRSSEQLLLTKRVPGSTFSHRAFSNSAPVIWNSLCSDTRHANSFGSFRVKLKTELFRRAYDV